MNKNKAMKSLVVFLTLILGISAHSVETEKEKTEATVNKTVDSANSSYREMQDKGCEMINGKMQCLGKKIKHKTKNMSEKTQSKAKELKNKVD